MMTPFLALVIATYAAFTGALATVWALDYAGDLRDARRANRRADD